MTQRIKNKLLNERVNAKSCSLHRSSYADLPLVLSTCSFLSGLSKQRVGRTREIYSELRGVSHHGLFMHPEHVLPSSQVTHGVLNCRNVEVWSQERPELLWRGLVQKARNFVTEEKHILSRLRRRTCYTSLHAKFHRVDDKTVRDVTKFVIWKLCWPWRRVKYNDNKEEIIYVFSRRNYKVDADVGLAIKMTQRYTAVLDTEAGFIRNSNLSPGTECLIKAPPTITLEGANGNPLSFNGQFQFHASLGTKRELVTFYVVDKLSTSMILLGDLCDSHVEAIRHLPV